MVDKRLILAVAGSGKTTELICRLNLTEKFFLVTYTVTNASLLRTRIIKRFGYMPENIKVFTYFNFLYGFCIKPFLLYKYGLKGVYFESPPKSTNFLKNNDLKKYISPHGYVYHNRMAKLIEIEGLMDDVRFRLEMFCKHFYYDEVQDLGGHDFNFMLDLSKASLNFLMVGDFYQNTYVTSFDGNVNGTLYQDYAKYIARFKTAGIEIDTSTLSRSWRCSPVICEYITQNLGIKISSHRSDQTELKLIDEDKESSDILLDDNIIKLVYQNAHKKTFWAKNWGECKGEDDFVNVCVILNKKTHDLYTKAQLERLPPRTKNKLYVAISRTKGNCYFMEESLLK